MFNQGFTVTGSSLKLLQPGDQGVILRLQKVDNRLNQKLSDMGIQVGTNILLEQRFPHFLVKVGSNRFVVENSLTESIYVRLEESRVTSTHQPTAENLQSLPVSSRNLNFAIFSGRT